MDKPFLAARFMASFRVEFLFERQFEIPIPKGLRHSSNGVVMPARSRAIFDGNPVRNRRRLDARRHAHFSPDDGMARREMKEYYC